MDEILPSKKKKKTKRKSKRRSKDINKVVHNDYEYIDYLRYLFEEICIDTTPVGEDSYNYVESNSDTARYGEDCTEEDSSGIIGSLEDAENTEKRTNDATNLGIEQRNENDMGDTDDEMSSDEQ